MTERCLERRALPGARADRLYFATVHEDPLLEIDALAPQADDTLVVVSSGGCTALSLLAAGAGRVVAVDLNATQNHVVELKAAAVAGLGPGRATAFLGGAPEAPGGRAAIYAGLRAQLSEGARRFWDARRRAVERGVIGSGVTERFQAVLAAIVRCGVHTPAHCQRLLACRTLEEQRTFYHREWNTWRWRALHTLFLGRWVFNRTWHPAFFEHVENPSFARHFHALFERTITELPVRSNYFLHRVLAGGYPADVPGGVPPYLATDAGSALTGVTERLTLVDGSVTDYLKRCADRSVDGFALSNICEWMGPAQQDELFAEVARTAKPGARVAFRNHLGWTEVPAPWAGVIVEDRPRGEALIRRDRSMVQRRIAPCRVVSVGP